MDKIVDIYSNYASYLWKVICSPFNADNYFYYLIYVSIAVWLLEVFIPWRKNQAIFRKDFWMDAFFMFFNFYIFNLLLFVLLSTLTANYFNEFVAMIGLPSKGILSLGKLPLYIQFPVFFIVADFTQWCIHYTLHKSAFLWKFHKVHHSVTEMGFAAHLRYHWVETFVYKTGMYLVLSWLLNFNLGNAFILHAFTIFVGHLNHTNVGWDYGVLKYVLNNPKMHIWHHAKELPTSHPFGMNFGITLSCWDYIFKTNYVPYDGRDIELGFPAIETYPRKFWQLMFFPFKDK